MHGASGAGGGAAPPTGPRTMEPMEAASASEGPAADAPAVGMRRAPYAFAILCGWMVWGAIYAIYLRRVKEGQTDLQVLHYAFSDAVLWALATPFVFALARRFPVRAPHALARLLVHAVVGPAVAVVVLVLDAAQDQVLHFGPGGWTFREFLVHSLPYRWHSNLLIYSCLVAIGHWLEYQRRLRVSEHSVEVLRAELAETQLRSLRSQLRPHFLFNCLNTIVGLVETRPSEARRTLGQLSELLRVALRTPLEETIPLREELRFAEAYLALEKARLGDRLSIEVDVEPEAIDVPVPAILLQPLVENAVRHGLAPRIEGGCVGVRARLVGPRLELLVDDDGIGFQATEGRSGIGLSSVRRRLRALYGDEHSCEVHARAGGGTEVAISVPVHQPVGRR